uniref:Uncharacterized protein n=1 Tax=Oryctolagus cuniculus TaxID=9986 RepID=A0A5F9D746_RABIT
MAQTGCPGVGVGLAGALRGLDPAWVRWGGQDINLRRRRGGGTGDGEECPWGLRAGVPGQPEASPGPTARCPGSPFSSPGLQPSGMLTGSPTVGAAAPPFLPPSHGGWGRRGQRCRCGRGSGRAPGPHRSSGPREAGPSAWFLPPSTVTKSTAQKSLLGTAQAPRACSPPRPGSLGSLWDVWSARPGPLLLLLLPFFRCLAAAGLLQGQGRPVCAPERPGPPGRPAARSRWAGPLPRLPVRPPQPSRGHCTWGPAALSAAGRPCSARPLCGYEMSNAGPAPGRGGSGLVPGLGSRPGGGCGLRFSLSCPQELPGPQGDTGAQRWPARGQGRTAGLSSEPSAWGTAEPALLPVPRLPLRRPPRFFGTKWMMFLAVGIYALFVSTNYWERYYTLVPSAVALGMAIVPLWASVGNYITRMAQKYCEYTHYKEQ